MWTKDVWTCDEDSYYGLPYVTDADLPIAIDHSQIRSMWTIMPPFNYDLPFIRLAENFKYAYGIYVYNTEVETVYTGNHLISHVYTGDTLIKPY